MSDEYSQFEESFVPDDAEADAMAREQQNKPGEPTGMASTAGGPPPPVDVPEQSERRQRRQDGGNREPKPRGIEDYRNGGFYIRNKIVEKETGDIYWIVSPENPDEREQQFKVKAIADPSADKTGLTRNMDAWMNDVVQVSLVRRQGAEHWEVWKVAPPPSHKDRIINRVHASGNGDKRMLPALEWVEALDTQVDLHHQYRNYAQTAKTAQHILSDPDKNRMVREDFSSRMTDEVSRLLAPRSPFPPEEIQAFIDAQFNMNCTCVKDDVSSILTGREESASGLRRVFYNTEIGFEKQFDLSAVDLTNPDQRKVALSALANYCAQKSVTQTIAQATCMPIVNEADGSLMSAHEASELELVKSRTLFATNPLIDSRARDREERELSEMNAAQVVRTLMAASGAKASAPQHDDVRKDDFETLPNGGRSFATFGGEVLAAAQAGMPTSEEQAMSPVEAARKAQNAVLAAAVQKADETTKKVAGSIIWVQKEGGALKPPFSLEGPDTSKERAEKLNKVAETVSQHTTKAASGAASFIEKVNEPVVDLF